MSKFGSITKGVRPQPLRVLIYGTEGVGKSTFGAHAPLPVFLPVERGSDHLDVARFPTPTSWRDALECLDELRSQSEYSTIVIDTLDALEPLCWDHVCATRPDKAGKRPSSIEAYGYGAGYALAAEEWRALLAKLDTLHIRGMHVVLVAHATIKRFENPLGENFDRWELKLHKLASALMREWSDAVLFASHETLTTKAGRASKGFSSGQRLMHTEQHAAYDAKNRYALPAEMPLDFAEFFAAVQAGRRSPTHAMREEIEELLRGAPSELVTRVREATSSAGDDPARINRIVERLRSTMEAKAKEEEELKV